MSAFFLRLSVFFLGAAMLTGCIDPLLKQPEEVNSYVNRIKERKAGNIDEIPSLEPYRAKKFNPKSKVDPFYPLADERQRQRALENAKAREGIVMYQTFPYKGHRKSFLETLDLSELVLVGLMEKNGQNYALLKDPNNFIHRVTTGMFLGKNYGQIRAVKENLIQITELFPDDEGNWVERATEIKAQQKTN